MATRRVRHAALILFSGAVVAGVLGFHSFGTSGGAAAPGAPESSIDLAKRQVALARKVLQELAQARKSGSLVNTESNTDLWWKRLIESLRDSHADKAEIVQAIRDFADYSKAAADTIEALARSGGVPKIRVYDFQYESLEAQSWLARELEN